MANTIQTRVEIDAEGAESTLDHLGEHGEQAFKKIANSAKSAGTGAFEKLTGADAFRNIREGAESAGRPLRAVGDELRIGSKAALEFREALHIARPLLAEFGLEMGSIREFSMLARLGVGALAAVVGTEAVLALGKFGDETINTKKQLGDVVGNSAVGGKVFESLRGKANELNVDVGTLAKGYGDLNSAIKAGSTISIRGAGGEPPSAEIKKTEDALGGLYAIVRSGAPDTKTASEQFLGLTKAFADQNLEVEKGKKAYAEFTAEMAHALSPGAGRAIAQLFNLQTQQDLEKFLARRPVPVRELAERAARAEPAAVAKLAAAPPEERTTTAAIEDMKTKFGNAFRETTGTGFSNAVAKGIDSFTEQALKPATIPRSIKELQEQLQPGAPAPLRAPQPLLPGTPAAYDFGWRRGTGPAPAPIAPTAAPIVAPVAPDLSALNQLPSSAGRVQSAFDALGGEATSLAGRLATVPAAAAAPASAAPASPGLSLAEQGYTQTSPGTFAPARASGGYVRGYADGGPIKLPGALDPKLPTGVLLGEGGPQTIPGAVSPRLTGLAVGGIVMARISHGETYVPPDMTARVGLPLLHAINATGLTGGGPIRIKGPGTGTSDSIVGAFPIGSFILNAKATERAGGLLEGLRDGSPIRFDAGGPLNSGLTDSLASGLTIPQMPSELASSKQQGSPGRAVHLHFDGQNFQLHGPENVVDRLERAAVSSRNFSAFAGGRSPAWRE